MQSSVKFNRQRELNSKIKTEDKKANRHQDNFEEG